MPYLDKQKQAEAKHKHYELHKKEFLSRTQRRRKERREWFDTVVMKDCACIRCGESDAACLDFHHRDPSTKNKGVNGLLAGLYNKVKILKEIEKCDVLCSNCHRKLHRYQEVV